MHSWGKMSCALNVQQPITNILVPSFLVTENKTYISLAHHRPVLVMEKGSLMNIFCDWVLVNKRSLVSQLVLHPLVSTLSSKVSSLVVFWLSTPYWCRPWFCMLNTHRNLDGGVGEWVHLIDVGAMYGRRHRKKPLTAQCRRKVGNNMLYAALITRWVGRTDEHANLLVWIHYLFHNERQRCLCAYRKYRMWCSEKQKSCATLMHATLESQSETLDTVLVS